jgi:hypothetical protein
MNRKRLAITAAVIGAVTAAIANPVLTGRLPYCRPAHNLFISQQNDIARDAYFKTHGAPDPSSPDAGASPFLVLARISRPPTHSMIGRGSPIVRTW